MLTGLKEPSLACIFYKPEHNAKEIELSFDDLNTKMKYTKE